MTTDATRAHIDAETLAAWAEHGLSPDAAAGVELHLSHCDRCQEMLAAFVRSGPAAGAVILPFWTRRPVQWSAAGLAAAAALVAFVWIGRPPALPTPESTIAQAPIDSASAPAELRRDSSPSVAGQQTAKTSAPKAAQEVEQKKESARTRPAKPVAAPRPVAAPPPPASVAALPPPPPPAATYPPVMAPPVTVSAAAPVVTPVGGMAAGNVQMASRAESVVMDQFRSIEIVAPDLSIAAARTVAGGAGRGGVGGGVRSDLKQPAVPIRWRVIAGTHVERSLDAGATWNALAIEPSLTAPLIAGTATSQLVCWLVGGEGVVLVTTDGRTFRRVPLAESVRLTGVTATDGLRATVTAADGRKFSTVDGGLTWK